MAHRVKGHALTTQWSGEYGVESSNTGTCKCGDWTESASSAAAVRREYWWHLEDVLKAQKAEHRPAREENR